MKKILILLGFLLSSDICLAGDQIESLKRQSTTATIVASGKGGTVTEIPTYSSGVWTPALGATTTDPSITYSLQTGTWTKIGKRVFYDLRLSWSAGGSPTAGSGSALIKGLPFTISNTNPTNHPGVCAYDRIDFLTAGTIITVSTELLPNTTTMFFAIVSLDNAHFANEGVGVLYTGSAGFGKEVRCQGTYLTD